MAGANTTVIFATGSIVGNALAPDKSLATLPITIFVIGMASGILPTGAIARRYGRRTSFLVGTSCGVITGLLATFAVLMSSFSALLFSHILWWRLYGCGVVISFCRSGWGRSGQKSPCSVLCDWEEGSLAGIVGAQLVTHTMHPWFLVYVCRYLYCSSCGGSFVGLSPYGD
ncbi:MFS transporter [Oligella ureolytica]